jgi:radical SAM protein with 4Fe4S-binding SPASM domain
MWADKNMNVLVKPLVDWTENTQQMRPPGFICDKLWFWMKIQSDGKVYPCGHDFEQTHCLGDVREESLADIWTGEMYRRFREKMVSGWRGIDICRKCGYSPPRKRNMINNIGFCLLDNFTLTRLIFMFGYRK